MSRLILDIVLRLPPKLLTVVAEASGSVRSSAGGRERDVIWYCPSLADIAAETAEPAAVQPAKVD